MREIPSASFPEIAKLLSLPNPYTIGIFFDEFVWPHPAWSQDEAYRATFKRCSDRIDREMQKPADVQDDDFERIGNVIRRLDFAGPDAKPHIMAIAKYLRRIVNTVLDAPIKESTAS